MTPEEQVRQALYTYARGADRLDRELVAAAFWPDARIALGRIYEGDVPGFVEVVAGFMGQFAATRHDIGQVVLARDGEAMGYEAYVQTWHRLRDRDAELVVLGRYVGRATERDGRWRLAQHGELMDWGAERAVDSGWFEAGGELDKGRRDRDDGSYRWLAPAR